MLNSTTWLYGAEVLPMALRSKVMGLAACSHFVVNVAGKLQRSSSHFLLVQSLTSLPPFSDSYASRPDGVGKHR